VPRGASSRSRPDVYDYEDEWDSDGWEEEVPQPAPYRKPSPPKGVAAQAPIKGPSVIELKEAARQAGIRNYGKMSRAQLIEALS
jgi:hypothetical protein